MVPWRRVIAPTHPDASRRRDPDRHPCSVAAIRVLTPAVGGSLEATTLRNSLLLALEHLQPLEAPGPKSGDIFARIGCKTGVGGSNFPVVTPAFADIVSK
jgi:hypothetical protein